MIHKVHDFKGYIEVPREVFRDIETRCDDVVAHPKRYISTRIIPRWIKDLPDDQGCPSYEYKGYIILQGRT